MPFPFRAIAFRPGHRRGSAGSGDVKTVGQISRNLSAPASQPQQGMWQAQPPAGVPMLVTPAGAMVPQANPQVFSPQTVMYQQSAPPTQPMMVPGTTPAAPNRGYTMPPPPASAAPNGTANPPAGQAKEGRQWNVFGR